MKRWSIFKFKHFPKENHYQIKLMMDILEWKEYNKNAFDWVDAEWPARLKELEEADN